MRNPHINIHVKCSVIDTLPQDLGGYITARCLYNEDKVHPGTMANEEQLKILRQGAETTWNEWRMENHDERISLSGADLHGADLRKANLSKAHLRKADLCKADLHGANLSWADLRGANLSETDLSKAYIRRADLRKANLNGAELSGANISWAELSEADLRGANLHKVDLSGTNLRKADLREADLSYADLRKANLSEANLEGATLVGCNIYAISAWGLKMKDAMQRDLVITPKNEPDIAVDNIEVAQFIYLLLHNEKIRDVIDTIAKKAVLILGRFTPERKAVLDALRTELRWRGYLPILFDFEKPSSKDFTETIKILAGMSLFIIADISNPRSSPLELQATVPEYMVPFALIIQNGEEPFAMFKDLYIKHKKWVMAPLVYNSVEGLISILDTAIIGPAMQVHKEILMEKAAEMPLRYEEDYKIRG